MARYSKSVLSYTDVHQVFERAGRSGTITLEFEVVPKAVNFVSRANAYRVLLRTLNEEAGRLHACDFDHLVVKRPQKGCIVTIEPRGYDFKVLAEGDNNGPLSRATLLQPSRLPHELTAAEAEAAAFLEAFERGDIK